MLTALILGHPLSAAQVRTPVRLTASFPLAHGRWQLKLDSVFEGTALPSAWSNSRFDNGEIAAGFNPYEQECFDPSRVAVAQNGLMLRMIRKHQECDGRWRSYSSGIATTLGRWSFKYGLVEARIWVPGRGNKIVDWPAVWLGGKAEIDILEGGKFACWYYHIDQRRWGRCLHGVHIAGGWHTVAVNWEPHGITWYYDRHEVAAVSSHAAPITSAPKVLVLDLAISKNMRHEPKAVPATFRVGWVRVWQHVR